MTRPMTVVLAVVVMLLQFMAALHHKGELLQVSFYRAVALSLGLFAAFYLSRELR